MALASRYLFQVVVLEDRTMELSTSTWQEGLKRVGEYYEGFVKMKNVDDLLAKHSTETVTTYGTRRSRTIGVSSACLTSEASAGEKENHQSSVSHFCTSSSSPAIDKLLSIYMTCKC